MAGFDVNYIDFKMTNNSPFEGESIVDAFSPEPGLFQNLAGTRPRFDTDTTQFALFTEGLIRVIGRFNLLAGLRYDHTTLPETTSSTRRTASAPPSIR